ncbi:RNA polymerase sigma-70 factor (family 1) [Pedobacter africanus]|uniref:RNA polymerase sigma-70 factor (ECF subfamily) n=1 Tax=Pedobacter africanus TaxID=151894 RepID=A0ACC6KYE1_9SPHI|nr:RNA polymerase sigma-70 factor [Pedobacter africanus]MDR6784279.1 RNA polymerase sigma-70 factor (ECF subfamily) [Pedobacter africanus]
MAAYSAYTDQELAALLKEGDGMAYTEIYDRYWPVMFRHSRKMLRDDDEAIDVVQDIFTTLWAKAAETVFTTSIRSFLYSATRNKVIDLINRNKVRTNYLANLQEFYDKGEFLTEDIIREKELINRIEMEVAKLPEKMRKIFELSRKHHLSYKEISEITNVAEGTVKKQVHNAIKILRLKLHLVLVIGVGQVFLLLNKIFS